VADHILFQVLNMTRQEMFFGTTPEKLDAEIEKLAKDPGSPFAGWGKGDALVWRALTLPMAEGIVRNVHQTLEGKTPPNKFKVIRTFRG
jgi:hypothetical protein